VTPEHQPPDPGRYARRKTTGKEQEKPAPKGETRNG